MEITQRFSGIQIPALAASEPAGGRPDAERFYDRCQMKPLDPTTLDALAPVAKALGMSSEALGHNPFLCFAIREIASRPPNPGILDEAKVQALKTLLGRVPHGVLPKVTPKNLGEFIARLDAGWRKAGDEAKQWLDARGKDLDTAIPISLYDYATTAEALDRHRTELLETLLRKVEAKKIEPHEVRAQVAEMVVLNDQILGKAGHRTNLIDNVIPTIMNHPAVKAAIAARFGEAKATDGVVRMLREEIAPVIDLGELLAPSFVLARPSFHVGQERAMFVEKHPEASAQALQKLGAFHMGIIEVVETHQAYQPYADVGEEKRKQIDDAIAAGDLARIRELASSHGGRSFEAQAIDLLDQIAALMENRKFRTSEGKQQPDAEFVIGCLRENSLAGRGKGGHGRYVQDPALVETLLLAIRDQASFVAMVAKMND